MKKRGLLLIALLVLSLMILVYAQSFDSGKLVLDNNPFYNRKEIGYAPKKFSLFNIKLKMLK